MKGELNVLGLVTTLQASARARALVPREPYRYPSARLASFIERMVAAHSFFYLVLAGWSQ
jgi:hypothetical protein